MATQSVKDILNTETPKPSFVLSPSVPAPLPSGVTVTRNGQDNVARTLDPYSGKFEQVGEDTARVYGSDQSLLVEAASRTNHVTDSSDPSAWGSYNISFTAATSILKGETAQSCKSTAGNLNDRIRQIAGTFSSGEEVLWVIVEKDTASRLKVYVRDTTDFVNQGEVDYNFGTGETLQIGIEANSRILQTNGPNGGEVALVQVRYDPASGTDVSGRTRQIQLWVDKDENSDATIFHHAQIEEAPNASSPIVTGSSAKTRAGDNYTIFDYSNDPDQDHPDWWNDQQMTVLLVLKPRVYNRTTAGWGQYWGDASNRSPRLVGPGEYFVAKDGTASVKNDNGNGAYKSSKVALALTRKVMKLSVNGTTESFSHNASFLDMSSLGIGTNQNNPFTLDALYHYPRALPESTLNTLTS